MTKPVQTTDHVATIGDFAKANQLSTTRLTNSDLDTQAGDTSQDATNWLALLTPQANVAETQAGPRIVPQPPSGMVEHRKPPRMSPTVGSRLTTGLKRSILLMALAGLAVGALAAGAYVVTSTAWFSALLSPPAPSLTHKPATTTGAKGQSQPGNAQSQSKSPAQTDTTAIQLRDKGVQQYRAGNFSASIDLLENSVSADGGDAISYYQLGLAYMAVSGREHALDDAEMAFRTAISLQPTWAAPHQLLAESLLRRGFYNEAITSASQATKLDPTQSDAWLTLGRAYRGAGKQAEASQAFAEAARRTPPVKR